MNKKTKKSYEEAALRLGLALDEESGAIYGKRGGFDVVLYAANANSPTLLTAAVSVRRAGALLTKKECKGFAKENKPVVSLVQNGNLVSIVIKSCLNQEKWYGFLDESLTALTSFLRLNGFENCCQVCSSQTETDTVLVGLSYMHLCPECYEKFRHAKAMDTTMKQAKPESVVGGIIGAFLGSVLGVLCIVILGQLGYVAALSGFVMAVCTMKGYELLGRKLSVKGTVISVLIMLVMTYVGNQLDWAVALMREVGLDIVTAYQTVDYMVVAGMMDGAYWANLVLVYLFALLGAVPTVINAMKNQKGIERFHRLGSGT